MDTKLSLFRVLHIILIASSDPLPVPQLDLQ